MNKIIDAKIKNLISDHDDRVYTVLDKLEYEYRNIREDVIYELERTGEDTASDLRGFINNLHPLSPGFIWDRLVEQGYVYGPSDGEEPLTELEKSKRLSQSIAQATKEEVQELMYCAGGPSTEILNRVRDVIAEALDV